MTNISNYGLGLALTGGLQSQQTTLSLLSQQVSSGDQYSNLTQYAPTDAHNILDFQNGITQRQAYLSSITNAQTRLSVYNSTMTDMESMAAQASTLATQNQTYNPSNAADIAQQANDYLRELADDLNQQVGGRYIYAGTRYSTQPVTDLTSLSNAPSATTTTSPALPTYDANYTNGTSFTVNTGQTPTGNFQMGNTTIAWSSLEGPSATSPVPVIVNGVTKNVAVAGLLTATTPTAYAANLAATLAAVGTAGSGANAAGGIPSGLTASSNNGTVSFNLNGATANSVTPTSGIAGKITWVGGNSQDGTVAETPNSDAAAYTKDSVLVDSNYSITYGVSSNDPAFQKLVNGLRFISAAVTAGQGGDTATYQADMVQASTLISDGLSGVQDLHAGVANNQNILTQESTTQRTDITNLQDQLTNIQQVNLTQVGTEINLLQTQLQASYSATASLEQLSLVKFL